MSDAGGPVLWFVAGPDGVGKTTYAFRHISLVSGSVHFVNVDEIARGISPLAPEIARRAAARVALERVAELIQQNATLSIETTLAGLGHLRTVERARLAGYATRLLYFMPATVDICLGRIARRVAEGGHDVPEADVWRRFFRSMANFQAYCVRSDIWRVFDANGPRPRVIAEGRAGCVAMTGELGGLPDRLSSDIRQMPPCPEA